jgi:hypothetical protein
VSIVKSAGTTARTIEFSDLEPASGYWEQHRQHEAIMRAIEKVAWRYSEEFFFVHEMVANGALEVVWDRQWYCCTLRPTAEMSFDEAIKAARALRAISRMERRT